MVAASQNVFVVSKVKP